MNLSSIKFKNDINKFNALECTLKFSSFVYILLNKEKRRDIKFFNYLKFIINKLIKRRIDDSLFEEEFISIFLKNKSFDFKNKYNIL